MDLGLDGALGLAEGQGEIGIGQAVDVPEHDGFALDGWERQEEFGPRLAVGSTFDDGGRARMRPGSRLDIEWDADVERERGPVAGGLGPWSGQVQDDRREPRP